MAETIASAAMRGYTRGFLSKPSTGEILSQTTPAVRTFQDLILARKATGPSRVAWSCSPMTWKWAPVHSTPPPSCAPSVPRPERRLRPAFAPPGRRPLRREPQPPAALLPVPGGEAQPGQHPGSVPGVAAPHRRRHLGARRALRRGQLGIADPRRLGSGLGSGLNGMEVTQFTYFQQVGGVECYPVTGDHLWPSAWPCTCRGRLGHDLIWADGPFGTVTYGDVFHQNEVEQSTTTSATCRSCSNSSISTRAKPTG